MNDTGAGTGGNPPGKDGYYKEIPPPRFDGDAPVTSGAGLDSLSQLDLGEEDSRLPWLEGDDDIEEERSGSAQGTILVLLGLLAIALVMGAVFWIKRGKPEQQLVADGGTIAAPKEPYKVRPDNPGGEVVAGTGDTSFAVAEGQRRPPSIGGTDGAVPADDAAQPPPKPSAAVADAATNTKAPAPAAAPVVKGVGVQVGAYASKEAAEAGWATLKGQYAPLSAVSHRVVQGQADIGTVYRLQAVPGDGAAARSLCSGMKAAGLSCQVKN